VTEAVIGLDCTGETFSVGLLADGRQTVLHGLSPRKALCELPAHLAHLMRMAQVTAKQVVGVGVTRGPGSFTGVRLGITLAKTACMVCDCEVFAVDTLALIGRGALQSLPADGATVAVALDARRKELYCAVFRKGYQDLETILETDVRTPQEFGRHLAQEKSLSLFVGQGFSAYPELVPDSFSGVVQKSASESIPPVDLLCRLTREAVANGSVQPPSELEPHYFRKADIQVSG